MKTKSSFALIALTLLATACGDSSGPDSGQLTRGEALAVASVILASGESAATASASADAADAPAGVDAVPIEFTHTHQSTHPCPTSGNVAFDLSVDGSGDDETGSFAFVMEGTQTHNDCAFPHQGLVITVDGDPQLAFNASAAITNNLPSAPFTFGVEGAFNVTTSDGRSDRCVVRIEAVTDFQAKRRTLSAEVCGHTVEETTTWS